MKKSPHIKIGLLCHEYAQRAAIYGLADLFSTANKLQKQYNQEAEPLTLITEIVEALPQELWDVTAVIIPPSLSDALYDHNDADVQRLNELHADGVLICSVCAGAFLLAQSGLLTKRKATTHWALSDSFKARYPDVDLDTDKLIIDDGDIVTAGGLMAWVDLGLNIVDRYLGSAIMLETARYLLVDPGGREQKFYSIFAPSLTHGDKQVLAIQHFLQKQYRDEVTVNDMADKACMTKRTFIRRFKQATNLNPADYLRHLRVGQARKLIESEKLSLEQVAWRVGYKDMTAFSRVFHKLIGLTPKEYKNRFAPKGL